MTYQILESRDIYEGDFLKLKRERVRYPSGYEGIREIVCHPGAVGVVAFTKDGQIPLISQYRHAVAGDVWEIPAGILEKGEDTQVCAARELREEVGGVAGSYSSLGWFYTTPGNSNEKLYLYIAEDVELGEAEPEDGEEFEMRMVTLPQSLSMIETGEIVDSKTIIGLLRAAVSRGVRPA